MNEQNTRKQIKVELHTFGEKNIERIYIRFNLYIITPGNNPKIDNSQLKRFGISDPIKYKIGDVIISLLNEKPYYKLCPKALPSLFGQRSYERLLQIKKAIDIQNEPIDPFMKAEMIGENTSDLVSYSVKEFQKAPGAGTFKQFNSFADFLSYEFASLSFCGHPIKRCDLCGCYFIQEKSNQLCCGSSECKRKKNNIKRNQRNNTPVNRVKLNAEQRIKNNYGFENNSNSKELECFREEFKHNRQHLTEPELIEWCDRQYRINKKRAEKNQQKSNKCPKKSTPC